jgi:hypothetical protein
MAVENISTHLLGDWIPSLPAAVGPSFIGWPPFLIGIANLDGKRVLVLRPEAGRSERQWKGFLSWMLGVAGARHFLSGEGYRWIAPISAFYPDAVQPVDLSKWNTSFPRSCIVATRRSGSTSHLFPDYLALRSTGSKSSYDWAVAEAKGTQMSLKGALLCPTEWSTQVRNVVIEVNGSEIEIPRYVVIATRVNANAKTRRARRLQLRAWNRRNKLTEPSEFAGAAVEIAAAHLFGFFRGLHLPENATAIALSVQMRAAAREGTLAKKIREDVYRASQLADRELSERSQSPNTQTNIQESTMVSIETEFGPIQVRVAEPVITLSRKLRTAESPASAAAALQEADSHLDAWEQSRQRASLEQRIAILPFGAEVHFPERFRPVEEGA